MFVAVDDNGVSAPLRDRDRDDLLSKKTPLDRGCGSLLAAQRKLVLIAAAHTKLFGDVFASLRH